MTNRRIKFEIVFFAILFIFSWGLMWKTFRVNPAGNLEIATKVWSDFAATIPLVRSFSLGHNFPPQYPLFAGPPIRYHFIFFLIVGLLEKIGIRIDWALNLLSSFSFFFLLAAIYLLAKEVFKKKSIAVLACVLFLFNGSLSFLDFFKNHPLSTHTLADILTNQSFPAFAPYLGNSIIAAFWNLNIYTNQRHLAFAYAFFLILVVLIYKASRKTKSLSLNKALLFGMFLGVFPFVHLPTFAMAEVTLFIFFLLYPKTRKKLFLVALVSTVIALPQIIYMGPPSAKVNFFHPGYLITNPTILSFVKYWFYNLGFVTILTPIGYLLAKKSQRKIFLPFLFFFLIGNLFQFSPEIAANHKFFNLFLIGANMFVAYALYRMWQLKWWGKIVGVFLFFLLTFSGFIDIFPIINDSFVKISDGKNNAVGEFINDNTPPGSVFLNASYLYDPASLAGRKIYFGWPYFSWSAGYNANKRGEMLDNILSSTNKETVCRILNQEGIDFIEIKAQNQLERTNVNHDFFQKNFTEIYYSKSADTHIYGTALSCGE